MKNLIVATSLMMALWLSGAWAKDVYKYQDEQGVWHYSDRKPQDDGASSFDVFYVKSEDARRIHRDVWVREETDLHPGLTVVNNYFGPVYVRLSVDCNKCLANGSEKEYAEFLVPGDSEKRVIAIESDSPEWKATYDIGVLIGDPAARHDDSYQYGLPFPEYDFQLVSQSFNGSFSHQDEQNKYAIDFALPLGTPVTAARDGVVMGIVEDYTEAGIDIKMASKANVIYLLHDDGTISSYAHLDMYSAKVKPGQRVKRGDMLARSGNTGLSTGPHLHFTVLANNGNEQVSIPFKFGNAGGEAFIPIAGQELKHEIGGNVIKRVSEENLRLYEIGQNDLANLDMPNSKSAPEGIGSLIKSWVNEIVE